MTLQEIDFLRAIYQKETLPFSYFKDKYALQLLSYFIQEEMVIGDLKKSHWGFLLNKAVPKTILSKIGTNKLRQVDLKNYWQNNYLPFSITIDQWGHFKKHRKDTYYQTTRPGFSLVLQLNFDHAHDAAYYKYLKPKDDYHPFRFSCHPVAKNNRLTMAWARIDLDFETGEVLIEEVQNDWLREVANIQKHLTNIKKNKKQIKNHWLFSSTNSNIDYFNIYTKNILAPYQKIWEEAILSAAIWFAKEELGLEHIFFHTYETGKIMKDCDPPKSIYSKLPKRFGFHKTKEAPKFIQQCKYLKKKLRKLDLDWWKL